MADLVQYYGTGRRKSAIARVFLRPGTGQWKVNDKAFEEYFVTEQQRVAAKLKVYRDDKHPHQAQKPEAIAAVV